MGTMLQTPFGAAASLAPPRAVREDLGAGAFVLRHPEPLQPHVRCVGDWLEHWAHTTPDALFLAERDATSQWRRLTYRDTREQVGRIAQAMLDLKLPADKPVVVVAVDDRARERGVRAGALVKVAAQVLGGGGGGKDDVAQGGGTDPTAVDDALAAVVAAVAGS